VLLVGKERTAIREARWEMKLEGEQVLMRIFMGEAERYAGKPTYLAIVEDLRKRGLAGATVLHAVAGFGHASRLHAAHLLDLSHDLPVVIEVVDTKEKIDAVLPDLDAMVGSGLITFENVHVIRYGKS
jgi:hypothetical protein